MGMNAWLLCEYLKSPVSNSYSSLSIKKQCTKAQKSVRHFYTIHLYLGSYRIKQIGYVHNLEFLFHVICFLPARSSNTCASGK